MKEEVVNWKYHFIDIGSSVVSMVTRLWDRWFPGSNPSRGTRFFSSAKHSDRPWGPPSLLFSGYRCLFPWWYSLWGMNLNTHLCVVPRLMNGTALPPPLMPSWCTEGKLYLFEYSNGPLVFIKGRLLSWVAKRVLDFETEICPMGLGSKYSIQKCCGSPNFNL